jgi:hypothetical protein
VETFEGGGQLVGRREEMRLRLIIIVGLALIAIVGSYVFNGAPSFFALTFQKCVACTKITCGAPSGGVKCHLIGAVCARFEPHVLP